MKTKAGRPKMEPEERKDALILLRTDDAEKAEFNDAAQAAGMKLSAWIRDRLSAVAKRELRNASRSS